MRAVSNTSPLSNLAIIGRLELLRQRYGVVRIPPAVAAELSRLTHAAAKLQLAVAAKEGWLLVEQPPLPLLPLSVSPDSGEHEAVALALALRPDVLLIDERRGRAVARQSGLSVAGVLGELLHGKLQGTIPVIKPELQRLRAEVGFFSDAGIERFILSQAGE